MHLQLQALLLEKAALAQENDRLQRENASLHQLLSFSRNCGRHYSDGATDDSDGSDWCARLSDTSSFYNSALYNRLLGAHLSVVTCLESTKSCMAPKLLA